MRRLVLCAVMLSFAINAKAAIHVGGIGGNPSNPGNNAADLILGVGDVVGTIDRSLTTSEFNSMSPTDLAGQFDVLLFMWGSDSNLNLDWQTRILPYLMAGGGVIWEDDVNTGDIASVVTAGAGSSGSDGSATFSLDNNFDTGLPNPATLAFSHFTISAFDPMFTPLIYDDGSTYGIYAEVGSNGGRIVIQGVDLDFHARQNSQGDRFGNMYGLLTNELLWVSSIAPIPEPTTLVIWSLLATLGLSFGWRRRRRAF